MSVRIDCRLQQKRRGSKVQDDEDEEDVVKYFKVKPENQVVKLGESFAQYLSMLLRTSQFAYTTSCSIGLVGSPVRFAAKKKISHRQLGPLRGSSSPFQHFEPATVKPN